VFSSDLTQDEMVDHAGEMCQGDYQPDTVVKNFTVNQQPQYKICPTCNGSKSFPRYAFDSFGTLCPTCSGTGKLLILSFLESWKKVWKVNDCCDAALDELAAYINGREVSASQIKEAAPSASANQLKVEICKCSAGKNFVKSFDVRNNGMAFCPYCGCKLSTI
jgi:hypothetical protein